MRRAMRRALRFLLVKRSRMRLRRSSVPGVGVVNGLAVSSAGEGLLLPIEAVCAPGRGRVTIAGIVEEEELSDGRGRKIRRMSMARGAAENAVVLLKNLGYPTEAYDLHLNFPGGAPVLGVRLQDRAAVRAQRLRHGAQRAVLQPQKGAGQAVLLDLLGQKVALGDLELFHARIAGKLNNIHTVQQRTRNGIQRVRGCDKQHIGQIKR